MTHVLFFYENEWLDKFPMLCSIIATYVRRRLFVTYCNASAIMTFSFFIHSKNFSFPPWTTTTIFLRRQKCSSSFWLKVTIDGWWSRVPVTWAEDTNSTLGTSPRTSWMFDSLIIRRQPQKIVDDNFQGGGSIFNIMVAIDSYIIVLFDQWYCHFYSLVLQHMEMKSKKSELEISVFYLVPKHFLSESQLHMMIQPIVWQFYKKQAL